MAAGTNSFAETALERGFITRQQYDFASRQQESAEGESPLGAVLIELGFITPSQADAINRLRRRDDDTWGQNTQYGQSLVGEMLGGCMLLEPIGSGSMGSTFRAHHTRLDREVAVKVMHPRLARLDGNMERFRLEAQVAAKLEHPNIVSIFDFDQRGPFFFIIMQFVEGRDLRELLQANGPFELAQAVWTIARVLQGLSAAHKEGIVHQDIKPANILLTRDPSQVYIADFGTVRLLSATTKESASMLGEIVGTPRYMSPEQATADAVDTRADLYSVGITLWELLEGRTPFGGNSIIDILEAQITHPLPALSKGPPELDAFLAKLTAKDREARFPTATAALEELQRTYRDLIQGAGLTRMRLDRSRLESSDGELRVDHDRLDLLAARLAKLENMKEVLKAVRTGESNEDAGAATLVVLGKALDEDLGAMIERLAKDERSDQLIAELLLYVWKRKRYKKILAVGPVLAKETPRLPAAFFFLGLAHAKNKDNEKARMCFARAVQLDPNHLPARMHLGSALYHLGRLVEAEMQLKEASARHPDSELATIKYAEFMSDVMKDYPAAIAAYERVIALAPERIDLRRKLGFILVRTGQVDEAEAVANEIVEWSDATQAGDLLKKIMKKRTRRMSESGEFSIPIDARLPLSEPSAAPRRESKRPRKAGESSRLIPAGEKKIGSAKKLSGELMKLAVVSGNWERVLQLYERSLSAHPRSVSLRIAFGNAAMTLERYKDAKRAYREALDLDATSREAYKGLHQAEDALAKSEGSGEDGDAVDWSELL